MLEREIVNAYDHWTRAKRRRRKLHMQHISRIFAELGAECEILINGVWGSVERTLKLGHRLLKRSRASFVVT